MKVVQVIDSLHVGGAERMAVNIANVLAEKKYKSILICTHESGALSETLSSDSQLHIIGKKKFLDFKAFIRFRNILRKHSPEVIHAHSSSLFWVVLVKFFIPKIIIVWHDHNGMRPKQFFFKNLPYRIFSFGIDKVISVNLELENWARKSLFVQNGNIKYIPNFPYLKIKGNYDSSESQKRITILMTANLRNPKDHHNLVQALAILSSHKISNYKVLFAGKYNPHSEYTVTLKEVISEMGLESIVQFLGEVDNIEEIITNVQIGVISSLSEGLPVSLLEYGLAALPVVVTDVGQCAEVVGHGEYGIVVPPGSPDRMAAAFIEIMTNMEEAKKKGIAFQNHVLTEYGSDKFIYEYQNLLGIGC